MICPDRTTILSATLTQLDATVNLVMHDIAATTEELWSRYDITADNLAAIIRWCDDHDLSRHVRLYFDDNRRSVFDLVLANLDIGAFAEVVIAAPVTSIGRSGYGTTDDLRAAAGLGVRVAAHGFSHMRVASYDLVGNLLATPLGGRYRDRSGAGRHDPMTENEALFQLVEAKEHFTELLGECTEFVLPHGCYNATTVALNQRFDLYTHLATTDPGLDTGQLLRPRFPVGADDTVETLAAAITAETSNP
ncbi:hypothetical protein OG225_40625 (plasmid) [Nocardia sp. NBC_01377]|uniref:hypothetical protein n=1 Tax=Nocardia sp. NBC_01377 TaxID=2903595 RepID=UPI002F907D48